MRSLPVVMRESDARMIRGMLACRAMTSSLDQMHLEQLQAKLQWALILESKRIPADVVTSQTRIRILDIASGTPHEFEFVSARDTDLWANRISLLAPLGAALLGYRADDEVEWLLPVGVRRLRIERVSQIAEIDTVETIQAESPADLCVGAGS